MVGNGWRNGPSRDGLADEAQHTTPDRHTDAPGVLFVAVAGGYLSVFCRTVAWFWLDE